MNLSLKNSSFYQKILAITFLSVFVFSFAILAKAQTSNFPNITNDFVLEPGKIEIFANPGQSIVKTITVTNRASSAVSFKVEVEDFIGSNEADKPVVLLGDEKSPYSIKDNIIPEFRTFTLNSNQSITIPIRVNIPINAQPGGFYASVLVSNQPSVDSGSQSSEVEGKTKLISRVGTLFFIRVNGVANESGSLEDFQVIYPSRDNPDLYKFNILFKNDGNVHLVPYGWITIKDTFGKLVGKLPVDAYFALPKSIRYREVEWNAPFLMGKYEATIQLNRGYGSDIIDTKTISFWIIPWMLIVQTLVILLAIFIIAKIFFRKYKLVARV